MNTTEVSHEFQYAVILSHLVCGSIFLLFNMIVCLLIVLDSDSRGKAYRKYLLSLQFFSTLADAGMSAYSPFVQANCRVIYANSSLMIYFTCIAGIGSSYFYCVYYRRNMLLPRESLFVFHGWKYGAVLIAIQICAVTGLTNVYYIISSYNLSTEKIPATISWVEQKAAYLILYESEFRLLNMTFAISVTGGPSCIIVVMILQLVFEIKRGMLTASPATKKYQARAVFSLIMQGTVPSMFLIIPVISVYVIYVYALNVGEDAARNMTVSYISILLITVMSLHAFVHSLTILACSPSYRKTVFSLLRRIRGLAHPASLSNQGTPRVVHVESSSAPFTLTSQAGQR
ncbi:hypothetical protein PRIPAC_88990 [Pristionchus pacificus]|uniref:G protein-coupled receptor n=1 Tax=Pristionchus pacificus TaxID=54126 RepID=A0A2A6B8P4_PRIPA|nr:hypothetical protein PRIPAC_88990 [Pristionchus pacificus]|eukprot:PDM62249.1 G protein-coupled receptor [Pristionchus pacificus]